MKFKFEEKRKELRKVDYKNFLLVVKGYFSEMHLNYKIYYNEGVDYEKIKYKNEIYKKIDQICDSLKSFDELETLCLGKEKNFFDETEHYYFWIRLVPRWRDNNIYIKIYSI